MMEGESARTQAALVSRVLGEDGQCAGSISRAESGAGLPDWLLLTPCTPCAQGPHASAAAGVRR